MSERPPPDELSVLIAASEDPMLLLDRAGTVLAGNGPAAAAVGVSSADVVGVDLAAVLGRNPTAAFQGALAEAWRTGEPQRLEAFSPVRGRWYRAELIRVDARMVVRFWDVSDRHQRDQTAALRDRLASRVAAGRGPLDTVFRVAATLQELSDVDLIEVWAQGRADEPLRRERRWWTAADSPPPGSEPDELSPSAAPTLLEVLAAEVPQRHDLAPDAGEPPRELTTTGGLRGAVLIPIPMPGAERAVVVVSTRTERPRVDHLAVLTAVHDDLIRLVTRQREWRDLSRLFRLSSEVLAVARRDGTFARVNPALCELLGVPEADLLSRPLLDFVHPDDVGPTSAAIADTVEGRGPARFTNRYVAADGQVRTLWWTVAADRAGEVAYVAARDVTELEREQELVEAQRDALRTLAEDRALEDTLELLCRALERRLPGALVSIQRYDPDQDVLRNVASPSLPGAFVAAVAQLPVGPDGGVCGRAAASRDTEVVADLATDERVAPYRALIDEHGLGSCWSAPLVAADGALLGTFALYRRTVGEPDADERRVAGGLSDLARLAMERDRDRTALLASEERFRLLAQATSDAIWDLDLRTGALWWGEGFETLFGYDRREVEPDIRSWTRRLHPDDRDEVLAEATAALEGEAAAWTATYRFLRADGSVAQVVDRGSIIRDGQGQAIRMIGGMVDQTERLELEQQYLRAQRMESVGTLAGGIAHDLNNALAPIVLATELLEGTPLDAEQAEHVRAIGDSARHGADVVRQVLTFARGVAGARTTLAARPFLEDLARMIADTFPKDVRVEVVVDGDPVILGDAVQLRQVLLNLAVNARDAMPGGGTLTLAADEIDIDEAYASMRAGAVSGRFVRLQVGDTGQGIPADVIDRVVEPFFSTKDPSVGTGLGLATSTAIAESHGGFLQVDSQEGRGTTVSVHIPVGQQVPEPGEGDEVADPVHGGGRVVLLVDDEEIVRSVTQRTLERHGYRCLVARDGAEAVALFARHRAEIAAVVTDLMMPVMDGVSATLALRRLEPTLRVLAVSGVAGGSERDERLPSDVPVLRKPFGGARLLAELGELLAAEPTPGG